MDKAFITTRAEWARLIHQELYLSIGTIKSAITAKRFTDGVETTVDSPTAASLALFTPQKTRTGVSVAIKKKSGRQDVPHAFIWRSHLWHRVEAGQGGLVGRLPIEMLFTTAIEEVAADHLTEMEQFAQKRLDMVFPKQLQYELSKCQ